MNVELQKALELLKDKVKELVQKQQQLLKANDRLILEREDLKNQLANRNKELDKLTIELNAQHTSNGLPSDNHKIEKDIDKYIKLIDQSIAKIQSMV